MTFIRCAKNRKTGKSYTVLEMSLGGSKLKGLNRMATHDEDNVKMFILI
jgi:hypothetical protein